MDGHVHPHALLLARETRQLSQAAVAKEIGVTQGLISRAESGVSALSDEQLAKLAKVLDYPIELFHEPYRKPEAGTASLYHWKRKTMPLRTLHQLEAIQEMRGLNVLRLMEGLDVGVIRQFYTLDPEVFDGPEGVAREMKRVWRVPHGPINDLFALIESAGGYVITMSFGTRKLFGMSGWMAPRQPLFLLNSDMPMDVLRWGLAHELGHLTMHGIPRSADLEEEADLFAGEFLAARDLIAPALRGLSMKRLPQLKMMWRISMKALIKRAEVLGAIKRDEAVRLYKQHSARGYNSAEPFPVPDERPTILREAVRVHLDVHQYTLADLARSVRLNDEEFCAAFAPDLKPEDANVIPLFPPA